MTFRYSIEMMMFENAKYRQMIMIEIKSDAKINY